MTRKRPPNRLETECRKFVVRDKQTETEIKLFVHVDRPNVNGVLGPVAGIRINLRHSKGSLMDAMLLQVSDYLSREVQTVEKSEAA